MTVKDVVIQYGFPEYIEIISERFAGDGHIGKIMRMKRH